MAYEKQGFVDNVTPLDAAHFNHMEEGIAKANSVIETVGGDTLTWDGNTDGLAVLELDYADPFYRVSDTPPALADFANGCRATFGGETWEFAYEEIEAYVQQSGVFYGDIWIYLPQDISADGMTAAKGLYFMNSAENGYVTSLTIPGYTGFTKEIIKQDALPEALQFGEKPTGGDTLTWDGNTEGSEKITMLNGKDYYRVSDAVLLETDLLNGFSVGDADLGEVVDFPYSEGNVMAIGGVLILGDENVLAIPADNCDLIVEGQVLMTFAKKGIYFRDYITSLTIPGYTGFTSVKKIDPKYLPEPSFNADGIIVKSSTPGSEKRFRITVDDSGTISAVEV